ncbi:unnamed protein product [Allacma fusca]|uniref:Uncharacterized protein n=1 Tax=Allacma fusca TaxID=39272 RepID=A0A8J2NKK9_9HEXA|nr:unnamed protein product [Allacma fusca]
MGFGEGGERVELPAPYSPPVNPIRTPGWTNKDKSFTRLTDFSSLHPSAVKSLSPCSGWSALGILPLSLPSYITLQLSQWLLSIRHIQLCRLAVALTENPTCQSTFKKVAGAKGRAGVDAESVNLPIR